MSSKSLATVLAVLLSLSFLGACTRAEEDPEARRIAVDHPANQPILGARRATEFCARFGAKAVRVQEEPVTTDKMIRMRRSTYECLPPGIQ